MEVKKIRHIQAESLGRFLECHIEAMRDRVREMITNQLKPPEDSESSISLTSTVILTLTESESSFSVFSSERERKSSFWQTQRQPSRRSGRQVGREELDPETCSGWLTRWGGESKWGG